MAKGNMFLGMARGSVGDVTFYRKSGQQAARVRNRNPRNPKTEAQVIQRMILATASKAYSRLKSITDHSFQGISYGSDSQSYFLKRAMDDIRSFVAQTYPEFPDALRDYPLSFVGLAEPISLAYAGVGLLISEGSIPSIPAITSTPQGGEPLFKSFGVPATPSEGIVTLQQTMNSLGLEAGDQLTIVGFDSQGTFLRTRYVLLPELTAEMLEEAWAPDGDGATYLDSDSQFSSLLLSYDANGNFIPTVTGNNSMEAAGLIISRKAGNVWQRSTQRLIWLLDAGDFSGNFADNVVPMWMAGTSQIDTENPYYLNQAEVGE